jgi:excisionase family DNA binding protein
MKRTLLSVKELAQELGISSDSVYRAYRTGEIPGAQIARIIRFDLGQVLRAMEERAKAMPNSQCAKRRATGGDSRRRAR